MEVSSYLVILINAWKNNVSRFCNKVGLKMLKKRNLLQIAIPRSIQISCVIETDLLNFHSMTLAALKTFFEKSQPKLTNYRRYKFYGNKK